MLSTEVSTQQIQNEWQKNTRQVQLSEAYHGMVFVYICVCVCVCVCICVYIYIFIYMYMPANLWSQKEPKLLSLR